MLSSTIGFLSIKETALLLGSYKWHESYRDSVCFLLNYTFDLRLLDRLKMMLFSSGTTS